MFTGLLKLSTLRSRTRDQHEHNRDFKYLSEWVRLKSLSLNELLNKGLIMFTTEMNLSKKDVTDIDPGCITAGTQYFLAEIVTPFHCGEAVVKLDKEKIWSCLFTLCNRVIEAIYSIPIEKDAVVRIIMEKHADAFDEFV